MPASYWNGNKNWGRQGGNQNGDRRNAWIICSVPLVNFLSKWKPNCRFTRMCELHKAAHKHNIPNTATKAIFPFPSACTEHFENIGKVENICKYMRKFPAASSWWIFISQANYSVRLFIRYPSRLITKVKVRFCSQSFKMRVCWIGISDKNENPKKGQNTTDRGYQENADIISSLIFKPWISR